MGSCPSKLMSIIRPHVDDLIHDCFWPLWVSFRDCPLTFRLLSHYHNYECVGCTTPHSQTKLLVLFFTSLYVSLLSFGQGLRLSITYLYGMHQVVSAHNYFFWVRCHPNRTFPPQRSLSRNPKIDFFFLSTTRLHPLNTLTCGPPPIYWPGTSIWSLGPLCMLHFV